MNPKLLIVFKLLLAFHVIAQDTIYFKNGNISAAKVLEIDSVEIKYHRFNAELPIYKAKKSDVSSIKYPNGRFDSFIDTSSTSQDNRIYQQGPLLIYHNKRISYNDAVFIIEKYAEDKKNGDLSMMIIKSKNNKKNQKTLAKTAIPIVSTGVACMAIGVVTFTHSQISNANLIVGSGLVIVAGGIGLASIICGIQKRIFFHKALKFYNSLNKKPRNH